MPRRKNSTLPSAPPAFAHRPFCPLSAAGNSTLPSAPNAYAHRPFYSPSADREALAIVCGLPPLSRGECASRGTLKPRATASLRDWPRRKAAWPVLRTAASFLRVRPSARRRVRTRKRPSADADCHGSRAVALHSKKRFLAAKNAKDTKSLIFVLKHQPTDEWEPLSEGLGVDAPDPRG